MARIVFGMNQPLDGYVDHTGYMPGAGLFRHFTRQVGGLAGSVYGRRLYEVMRCRDEDDPAWSADFCDVAAAWRREPKWVVLGSLGAVGPNATLVKGDAVALVRGLKARLDGEIEVGGPELARSLGEAGLIDEYRIYLQPVVVGGGKTFFAGARPKLRMVESEIIGEAIRLCYVPD